jgi:hypothetical protein
MRARIGAVLAGAVGLLLVTPAAASTYTYTYTYEGAPFTSSSCVGHCESFPGLGDAIRASTIMRMASPR